MLTRDTNADPATRAQHRAIVAAIAAADGAAAEAAMRRHIGTYRDLLVTRLDAPPEATEPIEPI